MFKRTTLLLLAVTCLATAATAQDLDFELTSVGMEVDGNDYRLVPNITLVNAGNLAAHAIKVATYYGPILVQEAHSVVDYVQNNHTCWNYQWPNCGQGDCLEIVTFSANWVGTCRDASLFFQCACSYEITPYLEWVGWTGEPAVTVVVDPDNEVPEADEDNNVLTIMLEPVGDDSGPTWSQLKALYR